MTDLKTEILKSFSETAAEEMREHEHELRGLARDAALALPRPFFFFFDAIIKQKICLRWKGKMKLKKCIS